MRLDAVAFQFIHQIVAGANAKRHDGERGILARVGSEARSAHDEKILDVVGLLELIQHGFFRITPHASDARFVRRNHGY